MKIGLFGGSFDPVHIGHLLAARAAREELGLDKLFFVPAAQSPFKTAQPLAPGPERLRMLRLALAGEAWCHVDDLELKRGGISYTVDTLRHYEKQFGSAELFYLIGSDQTSQLPNWRASEELARLAQFVVVPRPGEPDVQVPAPFRGRTLHGLPVAISSSAIRARVKQGLPVSHLTPPPVVEAIANNRLYL